MATDEKTTTANTAGDTTTSSDPALTTEESQLQSFLNELETQVANHSMYVWGCTGQSGDTITESWILSHANRNWNYNGAVAFWKQAVADGYKDVMRAFDCSGLGSWALRQCGAENSGFRSNAAGFYSNYCEKLTSSSDIRAGDFVFTYSSGRGKIGHVGYVVNNNKDVIHAKGGKHGVVKEAFGKHGWDYYGRPKRFKTAILSGTITGGAASAGGAGSAGAQQLLSIFQMLENCNPYIATIGRDTDSDIDMKKLKKNGIVALLIEGGYLYNDSGKEKKQYNNPKLLEQVNKAKEAELPFGLYFISRAKTLEDARKEISMMTLVIQTTPPSLGAWIRPIFTSSIDTNNKILDLYYENLLRLGLGDNIGLYCTKSVLKNKIHWSKFQDRYWLWLIDHVDKLEEIKKPFLPSFFVVEAEEKADA